MGNKTAIAQSFSNAAHTYDSAAFIEQEIGRRLLERLEYIKINPQRILDLGCGTGYCTAQLRKLFPQAHIIGLDIAFDMTKFASKNSDLAYCCGDAEYLPFQDKSFDLIFSNCCFPYSNNLMQNFAEIQNVLRTDGLLLFSTYGPDTLQELGLNNQWPDMHIIGDQLIQHKFINPVVDNDCLNFNYKTLETLLNDLQQTGAFAIDFFAIENLQQEFSITVEVVYGQAWGSGKMSKQFKDHAGNMHIPISEIQFL